MAKKTIQIKHKLSSEVLFECEAESIKEAVELAVSKETNLWNADLSYADLWNANLRNADLSYADLWNANLSDANLRNANLRNADLSYADLRNANLSDADLNAKFYNTKVTLKQRKYITEDTDLFTVIEESSSNSKENMEDFE
jgi:uncharacterized protein YjbI with pentapeptide repeats